jgi:archaellum biogenesis ATPase FlaH
MSVLQTALAYAKQDIRVIPIKQGEKRPPMQGWQNAATSDPATIRTWFEGQFKDCGLGIATGEFRNRYLIVIDIDDRPEFSGSDTLKDLEQLHGQLPDTVEVITGSGGRHIYFLTDAPIRNEASGRLGQGIDVRGIGGQVLAPPTVHPNGKTYEWVEGKSIANTPPADMPLWMVLILTEKHTDDIPMTYESTANILTEEGPASRYCAATTWPELLRQDGWTLAHIDQSGEAHWIRPGKDIREGTSATTGWQGKDIIRVFTTSIPNLPAGAYTRFGYTAAMHHNGDRSAFAKKLLQEGKALVPVTQPAITDNILINWQDFWTQSFPAEDWLIEPIIPRNQLVVIFAPGGTGKSLLALYIAAALATGREIFAEPKPPTNVLYMDYEMSQAVLYERLTAMGYNGDTDLSRLHYASLPPIGSLDKPEGAKQICDLARTCQAELVIIDTFARAVEGAENDADTVRNFYRWTAMNLKQEGRSLMRIDHAGKDLKKGARGTSAKNDDVDLVWQMTKVDGQLVLIRQKHRHTWIPERINLIIHDQAQMFTQDIKGGERLGQAMKMLEELNIDPTLSQDAMWTIVKDRAENIYKVSRKTTRLAHKQRKDQADENLLEDF